MNIFLKVLNLINDISKKGMKNICMTFFTFSYIVLYFSPVTIYLYCFQENFIRLNDKRLIALIVVILSTLLFMYLYFILSIIVCKIEEKNNKHITETEFNMCNLNLTMLFMLIFSFILLFVYIIQKKIDIKLFIIPLIIITFICIAVFNKEISDIKIQDDINKETERENEMLGNPSET